jgi:hypothetical protein
MQRIPRGVADDDRLAVVRTRSGELIALDPRTGVVRWRGGRGLRPCAVTPEAVVALRVDDPTGPAVVVLDTADGRELWTATLPPVPDWARRAIADDVTSSLDCTVEGEQVLLRWAVSTRYEGGAAPSRRVLAESAGEARGAVLIDLRARSLEPTAGDRSVPAQDDAATGPPAAFRDLGADVLDAGQVGGVRVELAAPATSDAVVLRGVNVADDSMVWEVPIDAKARRPHPLRP